MIYILFRSVVRHIAFRVPMLYNNIKFLCSYYTSTMFPTQSPRPIKRQRLMTPQSRGNVLVNAKVNSPQHQQQQIMLPTSPISNGNGHHGNGNGLLGALHNNHNGNGCNGMNGDQSPTMYSTNGQQHLLGPFKVYSKFCNFELFVIWAWLDSLLLSKCNLIKGLIITCDSSRNTNTVCRNLSM